eukprot:m.1362542 g.1362542  ORF g.1362542 m.1362542 type:complete len:52 (-) comp24942_c1_seq69:2289-2444(-)
MAQCVRRVNGLWSDVHTVLRAGIDTQTGETNKGFLKCTVCNENGLERCREC